MIDGNTSWSSKDFHALNYGVRPEAGFRLLIRSINAETQNGLQMADGLKRHSHININPLFYGCVTTLNSAYFYRMRAYLDYKSSRLYGVGQMSSNQARILQSLRTIWCRFEASEGGKEILLSWLPESQKSYWTMLKEGLILAGCPFSSSDHPTPHPSSIGW